MPGPGSPVAVDVRRAAGDWPDRRRLKALATRAIDAAAGAGPELMPGAELSVVFTDDDEMRRLNHAYRGRNRPTNVLSFPVAPPVAGRFGPLLGDIFLGFETVAAEAGAAGLALDRHAIHLIVHGFLHLVGYDHQSEREAVVMEGLETAILAGIGIADPYATP